MRWILVVEVSLLIVIVVFISYLKIRWRYKKCNTCFMIKEDRFGKELPEFCMRHYRTMFNDEQSNNNYFAIEMVRLIRDIEVDRTYRIRTHRKIIEYISAYQNKMKAKNSQFVLITTSPVPYKLLSLKSFKYTVQGHRIKGIVMELLGKVAGSKENEQFYEQTIRLERRGPDMLKRETSRKKCRETQALQSPNH